MKRRAVTKGFYNGRFANVGHAVDVPAPEPALAPAEPVEAPTKALDNMTKDELLAEAERRGVEVSSSMLKADVLAALKAAE